jgi:hypothetical protein
MVVADYGAMKLREAVLAVGGLCVLLSGVVWSTWTMLDALVPR